MVRQWGILFKNGVILENSVKNGEIMENIVHKW
jgi:hypothetical protein